MKCITKIFLTLVCDGAVVTPIRAEKDILSDSELKLKGDTSEVPSSIHKR